VIAAFALIAVTIFVRRRLAVALSVSLLLMISAISVLGVVSSVRLARVRFQAGTLRDRDPFVEALNIDRDWTAVLFLSNLGLGVATIVLSRRQQT
jgi:hypothetical protein